MKVYEVRCDSVELPEDMIGFVLLVDADNDEHAREQALKMAGFLGIDKRLLENCVIDCVDFAAGIEPDWNEDVEVDDTPLTDEDLCTGERWDPCDGPDGTCPFNAQYGRDCVYHCGFGADDGTTCAGVEE